MRAIRRPAPADALRGAREMLTRLDQLNHRLEGELRAPLRIGIGIHFSEAIVGAMGPPRSRIITAIGDTVNTCARLESLTKEYDCALILSRPAAEAAGLDARRPSAACGRGQRPAAERRVLRPQVECRRCGD